MKIVKVYYCKLVSDGKTYGNQTVGAEAVVEPDETPREAIARVRDWVDKEFAESHPITSIPEQTVAEDARRALSGVYEALAHLTPMITKPDSSRLPF